MKTILLSILAVSGVLLGACATPVPPVAPEKEYIEYNVITEGESSPGRAIIEIIVSPDATKEQIMALADYLVEKYLESNYDFMYIDIFDSLESAQRFGDADYPLSEENKHHLVAIIINRSQDYIDIEWTAIMRSY